MSPIELIRTSEDWRLWHHMVTNVVEGLCDCMWVSFDPRERSTYGLATVVGGRGAMAALNRSPARLAQLLQPTLAFCFSLQPMTAYRPGRYAVVGCKLKQNANDGCNSLLCNRCVSLAGLVLNFTACFILLVIAPLVPARCAPYAYPARNSHIDRSHESVKPT